MNSIRVKLLLFFGSLLMLLGLFLIGYNRSAFIKDKNVYLFDSLAEKRNWDQEQAAHFIKDIKYRMEWIAYQFSVSGFLDQMAKQHVLDRDWGYYEIYTPDENQIWVLKEMVSIHPKASQTNSDFWRQHPAGFKFHFISLAEIMLSYKSLNFGILGLTKFSLGEQWLQRSNRYLYPKIKLINHERQLDDPNKQKVFNQFGQYSDGVHEVLWNSRPYLLAVTNIKELDLLIIDLVDKDFVMSSVKRTVNRTAALGAAILILGLLILGILATQLTSNLDKLAQSMMSFSAKGEAPAVVISSGDEIGKMSKVYNQMLLKIKQLLEVAIEQTRMKGELNTAKEVQATLLPKSKWSNDFYSVKGYYRPASECGGDIWFVHPHPGGVLLFVGDATGHGVSAALITAAVRSVLSVCVEQSNWDPGSILDLINRVLCDLAKGSKMMTGFVVSYDLNTRRLHYANASHDIPILIPPRREGMKVSKKDFVFLADHKKRRLGDKVDELYETQNIEIGPGSALLIYTDGVVDAQNKNQEPWGERRLIKLLVDLASRGLGNSMFEQMAQSIEDYIVQQEQPDDITFVTLYIKDPE